MPTFTSGNDTYTVSTAGNYDLDMLGGDDRLNVYGGTNVTAHPPQSKSLNMLRVPYWDGCETKLLASNINLD